VANHASNHTAVQKVRLMIVLFEAVRGTRPERKTRAVW
jgi:hypothetical protein